MESVKMIHHARIRHFIARPPSEGKYVLYWMQQSQRLGYNHGLAFAAQKAAELDLPLAVGFVLVPDFPEAGFRHYRFMLEGIADVQARLYQLGIPFIWKTGDMAAGVLELARRAAWVVTDKGYLRIQRKWRKQVAGMLSCPFTIVESDSVVPAARASDKQETAARTIRPKLMKNLDSFLDPVPGLLPQNPRKAVGIDFSAAVDPASVLSRMLPAKADAAGNIKLQGGEGRASGVLDDFIENRLKNYHLLARDPAAGCRSGLSPYLHFGHISPVEIISRVRGSEAPDAAKDAFIEQVLVRRELAINFVYYNSGYDRYESAVPAWAKKTLARHVSDPRPYIYSTEELETAQTHDPYWNAAQCEMINTGIMHNYMRMYWGKKIMEWSESPEQAYDRMLGLNNRWEIDGRDPNGFTGVAWCFGLHDRPWKERAVFGRVRYMNAAGLERKFKISEYAGRHTC